MRCPQCGQEVSDDAGVCPSCSAAIRRGDGQPAVSPGVSGLACPGCGGTRFSRGSKTIEGEDEDDDDVVVSLARCTSCGKVFDKESPEYWRFFADRFVPGKNGLPLAIGMKGKIGEDSFEILGRIRYQEDERYDDSWWEEWYLLSDSGERGFLVVEDGHFEFYTKTRPVEELTFEEGVVRFDGQSLDAEEDGYTAHIAWFEGQFPWDAKLGESTWCIDTVVGRERVAIERSEDEAEVWRARRIPARELFAGFGLTDAVKAYDDALGLGASFAKKARIYFLAGLVMLGLAIYNCSGGKAAHILQVPQGRTATPLALERAEEGQGNSLAGTLSKGVTWKLTSFSNAVFDNVRLDSEGSIHQLRLAAPSIHNEWIEATATLLRVVSPTSNELVYSFTAAIWHASGTDSEGYWSESGGNDSQEFVLDKAGVYRILLSITHEKGTRPVSDVAVMIHEGERSYSFLLVSGLLALFMGLRCRSRRKLAGNIPGGLLPD